MVISLKKFTIIQFAVYTQIFPYEAEQGQAHFCR